MSRFLGQAFLSLTLIASAQAQSDARISLSKGEANAGDSIHLTLTLDKPAECNTNIFVGFLSVDRKFEIDGVTRMSEGALEVETNVDIPKDTPSGEFTARIGGFNPCPGFRLGKSFSVPAATFVVTALPASKEGPTTASIALSFNQKQFLETKIAEIDEIEGQLINKAASTPRDSVELRSFLVRIMTSASGKLDIAEAQYREHIMKGKQASPAFFADLRRQYGDLITDLNAPVPGTSARSEHGTRASFVLAQLTKRKGASATDPPHNTSGTFPPSVVTTKKVLDDTRGAYQHVRDTGRITFDLNLRSTPQGARVFYKKMIDAEYTDYSSPTNVQNVELDLATWDFKFHKDGCSDDQVRRIDPYEESHPDVAVEFSHCGNK